MKIKFYLIILFSILLPFACKKYPDGPFISFRSTTNRVVGKWKVDKLYIDGEDSTNEYFQKLGCEIEFTKTKLQNADERYIVNLNSCNNGNNFSGCWYWQHRGADGYTTVNGNKYLEIDFVEDSLKDPIGPIGRGGNWRVLRLTKKELNISTTPPDNYTWNKPNETTYTLELKK
jgi:hypothetical protein